MTNNEWIELFFSEAYEKQINELMLEDRDYVIPYDTINNYVKQIIDIPYTEFLDFVKVYGNISYDKRDVPQYLDYNHCEGSMIRLLIEEDNTGFTPLEIGQLLCEPGWSSRYYVYYANRHLLSAKILGIVFEYFGHWYLNCIGYVYLNLEPSQQKSLLARTLLRSPFFKSIIAGNPKRISLLDLVYVIPYSFIKNHYIAITSFVSICITEAYKWGRKIDFDDHLFGRVKFKDILNFKALKKKSSSLSYSMYLNEVMSYYDIEEKEALQLYYRYKNGDRHAFDEIVKTAQSIVIKIASSYKFAPIEDIIQEGNLGLLEGIESFDQQKNYSFLGYLSFFVKRRIQSCQYEISSLIRLPLNEWQSLEIMKKSFDRYVQKNNIVPSVNDLDIGEVVDQKKLQSRYDLLAVLPDMICFVDDLDYFESNLPPTDDFQENEYNKYIVNNLLSYLGKRDKQLVKAYFGLEHDSIGETYGEIGERFGLTRERVRQIVFKSAKIMRENVCPLPVVKQDSVFAAEKESSSNSVADELKESSSNSVADELNNTIETFEERIEIGDEIRTPSRRCGKVIAVSNMKDGLSKLMLQTKEGAIFSFVTSLSNIKYVKKRDGKPFEWKKKAKDGLESERRKTPMSNAVPIQEQLVSSSEENNTDIESGNKETDTLPVEKQESVFAAEKESPLKGNTIGEVIDEQLPFSVGDRIEHSIWGKGVVKEIVLGGSLIGVSFNGSTIEFVKPSAIKLRKEGGVASNGATKKGVEKRNRYEKSFSHYAERIVNLKQAKKNGEVIVAKPVLLLALIDGVDKGAFDNNHFYLNEWLEERYLSLMKEYTKGSQFPTPTSINNPFWHLTTDGFWHLQLKEEPKEKVTPTKTWLKDNVLYASFDDDMWVLLQNREYRNKMRNVIIDLINSQKRK